jgi:ParB/RepB/Spo0J family partition protein
MAKKPAKNDQINLDVEFKRNNEFLINPDQIDLGQNGRWQPHPPEAIEEMYRSFRTERQLQAVEVRKMPGGKVQLVLGYRRLLAARLYNQRHPDQPMMLRAKIVTCNDEEALRRNVTENRVRSGTSAIDDAHNQRRFREEFGWEEAKIAEFYGVTPSYVGKLAKLLMLPFDVQMRVHNREIPVKTAISMTELSPEEQREVLVAAPPTNGAALPEAPDEEPGDAAPRPATAADSVSAAVTKKVREKKIKAGGATTRSLREVKDFVEGLSGPAEPKRLQAWCRQMLWFIQGKTTDDDMAKYLRELLK